MYFVDNEGLPQAEVGNLAIGVDNVESDEEVMAQLVEVEVDAEGVPEEAELRWDEPVVPDRWDSRRLIGRRGMPRARRGGSVEGGV